MNQASGGEATVSSPASQARVPWARAVLGVSAALLLQLPYPREVPGGGVWTALMTVGGASDLRTVGAPTKARLGRTEDGARGGYAYHARPTGTSRMVPLAPLLIGIPFYPLLTGALEGGDGAPDLLSCMSALILIIGAAVSLSYLPPGARYRRPAAISVSSQGVPSIPIDRAAEPGMGYAEGVARNSALAMPAPDGVPTTPQIARGLMNGISQCSFAVPVRSGSESGRHVLMGGLAGGRARAWTEGSTAAVRRFRPARPAQEPVAGGSPW